MPTTLIPPGDEWTTHVLELALDLGFQFAASFYLALRNDDRFCWTTHVCAPYLDQPDGAWFAGGLPVVGYFHDREPATVGIGWFEHWLDQWRAAGARRFMDFRELASAVGRRLYLQEHNGRLHLTIRSEQAPSLVRPVAMTFWHPEGRLPGRVDISCGEDETSLEIIAADTGFGRGWLTV